MNYNSLLNPKLVEKLVELSKLPIEATTAYKLAQILEAIQKSEQDFQAKRMELLKKYGKKDKKGNLKLNKDKTEYVLEDREAFSKEFLKLTLTEVEVPKISLDELKDLKISAENILILKPLLTE